MRLFRVQLMTHAYSYREAKFSLVGLVQVLVQVKVKILCWIRLLAGWCALVYRDCSWGCINILIYKW